MKSERPRIDPFKTACFILSQVEEALYFYHKKHEFLSPKITLISEKLNIVK